MLKVWYFWNVATSGTFLRITNNKKIKNVKLWFDTSIHSYFKALETSMPTFRFLLLRPCRKQGPSIDIHEIMIAWLVDPSGHLLIRLYWCTYRQTWHMVGDILYWNLHHTGFWSFSIGHILPNYHGEKVLQEYKLGFVYLL